MDYLNYGNKVQTEPQKPQPQGSSQQEIKLTQDDFSFGDLNYQGQQQVQQSQPEQTQGEPEIMALFATPVMIDKYPYDFRKELNWINEQECRKNEERVEDYPGRVNNEDIKVHNEQSKNTFLLDDPIMQNVRKFIQEKIDYYASNILGFGSEMVITQSWFNRNSKGMNHHEHQHPNSIISGVWYPQIDEQLPPIKFRSPNQSQLSGQVVKYNNFNSATFMLPMRNGELILFPSTLQHSVPTNSSDKVRLSLSFNTWCKGSLGDIKSLTYLPLERCV